jgi:GntR family transcriptional regulator / MocR family aminotransferase
VDGSGTTTNPVPFTQANIGGDGAPSDLFVALDRSQPRRLRAQVESALREGIQAGRIRGGAALPSSRLLARELGVSRSVILDAYGQLVAEGYLEAHRGARTQVVQRATPPAAADDGAFRVWVSNQHLSGLPDPASFPRREWMRHYRAVMLEYPDASFGYPEPQGKGELRRALADYLGRVRAVQTRPAQLVICGGFAQGLALICRALHRRGILQLAVEDPCFFFHRRIIRAAGLDPVPVRVDEHGLDVARLIELPVEAVLLSPAHSYPTGAVLSPDRRIELSMWARQRDAIVIEDDYDAEFRYDRNPIGALQGLAPDHVIYGGSTSKILTPALRLGWLAVPARLLEDVLLAKVMDDIATEAFGQLTLARFIETGALSRHLRRIRPIYRSRRDRLIAALGQLLPDWTPAGVAAGLHAFVWLPHDVAEEELVRQAHARKLNIEGAARHWADRRNAPPAILIGYGAQHEEVLDRTVASLASLALRATTQT